MPTRKLILPLLLAPLALGGCGGETPKPEKKRTMHDYSIYDKGVTFKDELWKAPEFRYDEAEDNSESKGLWIRNDYKGEESYNFAFLAKPKAQKEKYPAVVLVHGGGGTAYYEWAEAWAARGYVALALDLEGHVPNKEGRIASAENLYRASPYSAPHNTNLADGDLPEDETWLHYACRSVIIANSFLHHLEGVDIYSIGVCGVSWGGYITSIVSGYDDRFAFAIPIYCTKPMKESGTPFAGYLDAAKGAFDKFDNFEALSLVQTPVNVIMSDSDIWGDAVAFTSMVSVMKNARLTVKHRLGHAHYDAMNLLEPYTYADNVIADKPITSFKRNGNEITIDNLPSDVKSAYALVTEETNIKQLRTFDKERQVLNGNKITLDLGEAVTYFVVCIEDEIGNAYTSLLYAK